MLMTCNRRQRGFMMVEVLLGVFVVMAISAWMMREQLSMARTIDASNMASGMAEVRAAAQEYINANYTEILAAADAGTSASSYCVVNASATTGAGGTAANNTTKNTCAFDVNWLKYKGYLAAAFKATNAAGAKWAVIAKRVYDASANPTDNLEVLVVPASSLNGVAVSPVPSTNIKIDSFEKAAVLAGTAAGVVPDAVGHPCGWHASDNTQRYVCGVQGAWKAKLSDFVN